MSDREQLLTTRQMARFVADGFLRFDELVPPEINAGAHRQMEAGLPRPAGGSPLKGMWEGTPIGEFVGHPRIQGIMASLVGADPLYDHHAVHIVPANKEEGQIWHADAIIDTRLHFDVQFFYFPHDTPREMGGTMVLPGSHFRRISESDIARYQNFLGQQAMACKAGTVMVAHHGIWHCAQPNRTERTRYMFKLRLNPTVRQLQLWNTDDLDDPEVPSILSANHRWYGNEVRLEVVNRIKLWRFLTGQERFDVSYWLSRLENAPEARAA